MTRPSFRDVELLTVFLDGELSQADAARLETRLKPDPELRTVFDEMRQSRALLRQLPARRAPRNFTLTPKMAGLKPPLPRSFPVFRLASALAAVLFFFAYTANLAVPALAALRANATVVYGVGGGGGYGGGGADAAAEAQALTEAPMLAEAPAAAPAPTQEVAARVAVTATPEILMQDVPTEPSQEPAPEMKAAASEQPQPELEPVPLALPVSPWLLMGLLALVVVTGGGTWFVRARAEWDWLKSHALAPRKMEKREIILLALAVLAVLALALGIYWFATTTFYAPQAMQYPSGPAGDGKGPLPMAGDKNVPASGDKGPVPAPGDTSTGDKGGSKGGPGSPTAQSFTLSPGMGYNFSASDDQGRIVAVDAPADSVAEETTINYIPGYASSIPVSTDLQFFSEYAFTLRPSPQSAELLKPITISIDYGDEVVSAVQGDENRLSLYWWSSSEQQWFDAATTCEPQSTYELLPDINRFLVPVCKMGFFLLVAP
jgi:anti-sigma factor RsiW